MSSFEDIYHRVLVGSNRSETLYDRLFYVMTNKRQQISNILFPFLQVIPDSIFQNWYFLLQNEEPSLSDITTMTNSMIHISLHHIHIRRIIDLILIKCI